MVKHWRPAPVTALPCSAHMLPTSRCYAENQYRGVGGEGANMASVNANANAYDGKIINDPFELLEFVNWLRRSTRDTACVLLSQDAHGDPHVPLDQVRKTVGSRAATVVLDNAVQRSARDQLGIVNPHHGAARIFPPSDAWCDDSSIVYCVLSALPPQEFLDRIRDNLNALASAQRSKPAAVVPRVSAPTPAPPRNAAAAVQTKQQTDKPSLADVREDHKLFRIDAAYAPLCRDAILSPSRQYPCILVSLAPEGAEPYLNVPELLREIESDAVVFEIADSQAEDWLREHLPPWARAYSGACRFFYPRNGSARMYSDLHRMNDHTDSPRVVGELAEAVWNTAYPSGYSIGGPGEEDDAAPAGENTGHAHAPQRALVSGVVEMVLGSAAYVRAEDERTPRKATMTELPRAIAETQPLETLLRKGQHVRGHAAGASEFEIVPEWSNPETALRAYVPGVTVAGRVTYVCEDMLKFMLYPALADSPAVEVVVRGPDLFAGTAVNANADMRPVFSRGATIALHIEERDAGEWLFSLPSPADTVIEPPSVLPEGPAWLPAADALAYLSHLHMHSTLADVPVESLLETVDSVPSAKTTIRTMHRQLTEAQTENRRLEQANEQLREENADLVKRNREYEKSIAETNPLAVFSGRFASAREELDWQLRAQSLLQFTVEERGRRPLAQWSYGGGFFDSLAECEHGDMSRWSLIRTMLLVLAGKETLNGLRHHQLRAGRGGDNPGRKDAHGNTIYRCNVHGQYRLHFTRDGAERVTFLSVNTHGDLLL